MKVPVPRPYFPVGANHHVFKKEKMVKKDHHHIYFCAHLVVGPQTGPARIYHDGKLLLFYRVSLRVDHTAVPVAAAIPPQGSSGDGLAETQNKQTTSRRIG